MSWNNGAEWKKFVERMKKQEEWYRKEGMTEPQIKTMYEFDHNDYNITRREAEHTQPLDPFVEDMDGEDQNPLLKRFEDRLTTHLEVDTSNSLWWLNEIEEEKLYQKLKKLSPLKLKILSLYGIEGYTQKQIASMLGLDQQDVHFHLKTIRRILGGEEVIPRKRSSSGSERPKKKTSYIEMCLCPRCASVYYESKEHFIKRVDPNQKILDSCDLCRHPHGYDFRIWKNSTPPGAKSNSGKGAKR